MKKARITALGFYNLLISGLLSLLGFTASCDRVDEYGTPTAKFIIKGTVTSEETGQPVENINVKSEGHSILTDDQGLFQIQIQSESSPGNQTFLVQFTDIDSTVNGQFSSKDTLIEFKDPTFTGGDGNWYKGETTKSIDIKLSPEK